MRNLNKFIAGTNFEIIEASKSLVAMENENVNVKVIRYSVNEYEVTFNRDDRTYSYECQSQKEVISSIENDIAYHDSEVKEVAINRAFGTDVTMKQQFTNKQDNVTWVFLEDELKAIGSYINSFGERKTDVQQHESEKDFKSHLNTIKRSKHFKKANV